MKACRKCRAIQHDKSNPRCEVCNSTNLSDEWSGRVYIISPEDSEVAERLGITVPGEYALKVR